MPPTTFVRNTCRPASALSSDDLPLEIVPNATISSCCDSRLASSSATAAAISARSSGDTRSPLAIFAAGRQIVGELLRLLGRPTFRSGSSSAARASADFCRVFFQMCTRIAISSDAEQQAADADDRQIDVADPRAHLVRLRHSRRPAGAASSTARTQSRPAGRPEKCRWSSAIGTCDHYRRRDVEWERGRMGDGETRIRMRASMFLLVSPSPCLPVFDTTDYGSQYERMPIMKAAYINQTGPPENIIIGELPDARADRQPGARARGRRRAQPGRHVHPRRHDPDGHPAAVHRRLRPGRRRRKGWARTRSDSKSATACGARTRACLGRQGTFAEYAAVDEDWLYPTPDGVSDETAAACALVGITAHLGLVRDAKLQGRRNAVRQRRHRRRRLDGRADVEGASARASSPPPAATKK